MAPLVPRPKADAVVTMRMPARVRELIDNAAAAQGKSRTEFMVESARLHAIDVLLDQRAFTLDANDSKALAAILADPPKPNDALRALMAAGTPWA